jgi:hypothetical protein
MHYVFPLSLTLPRHHHADLEWCAFRQTLLNLRFRRPLAVPIIRELATSLSVSQLTQPILSAEAVVGILILPVGKHLTARLPQ